MKCSLCLNKKERFTDVPYLERLIKCYVWEEEEEQQQLIGSTTYSISRD